MARYSALLKDCKCMISNSKGNIISQVPLAGSLYKHVYAPVTFESANVVHIAQSIDNLHQCMGHILPHAIKELIRREAVTSLMLDPKSEVGFCEACAKAKPTSKPMPKEHTSPISPKLGDKVHSDVWGPAMPRSYDGKDYFISFTDDYSRWS